MFFVLLYSRCKYTTTGMLLLRYVVYIVIAPVKISRIVLEIDSFFQCLSLRRIAYRICYQQENIIYTQQFILVRIH